MILTLRELTGGCSFLVKECQGIEENKQANTSDYLVMFKNNVSVAGQFNLALIF